MQYRIDQRSGNKLSALGFGCMRFPRTLAITDRKKTEALILRAIENGVNYFDTAYNYPESETVLGEILHKNDIRSQVFIATKLPYTKCRAYEDFDRLLEEQLKRLQTSYIDYYLIHSISEVSAWNKLCEMGIERWIAEKKQQGKISQIGFSFHGVQSEFMLLLSSYDWDFCMIQYNYYDENYQAGRAGLVMASSMGLPVIIMEPLLGGKLATGLPKEAERCFRSVDSERTPASWALRWLWNQPEVTVVLSGMSRDEQLDDNLATARVATPGSLSDRETSVFAPVIATLKESFKIPCTGCGYCVPCPRKVNIPGSFAAYNASYSLGFVTAIPMYVTGIGTSHPEKNYSGKHCTKCGVCEKLCPQHIEIIKSLEDVTKRMEPFWFNAVMAIARKVM